MNYQSAALQPGSVRGQAAQQPASSPGSWSVVWRCSQAPAQKRWEDSLARSDKLEEGDSKEEAPKAVEMSKSKRIIQVETGTQSY